MQPPKPRMDDGPDNRRTPLGQLAKLFLKLGTIAFGGPAAHIAMIEDEVVRRRSWLTHQQFLDMLGATNLIPGPNSTEMAIHVGYKRAGLRGLVVAGTCFILPAVGIVMVLAWVYVRFGKLLAAEGLLYGVKPVVIAVVAQALWRLGRSAVKGPFLATVFVAAAWVNWLGVNELIVLFATAAFVAAVETLRARRVSSELKAMALLPLVPLLPTPQLAQAAGAPLRVPAAAGVAATTAAAAIPVTLWPLFLIFLKIGSVLFGSGYVLLAFLRSDLVERTGWLTEAQLLDAVAIGQVTPGPVFTTATFIGYMLAGPAGALVATVGIFLPAFFFVAISAPFIPRLRRSVVAGRFLDGLNVASLALMAVVTVQLAATAVFDGVTALMAVASTVLLIAFNVNSTWLVAGGALLGLGLALTGVR